jgi:hypothetical protein
MQLATYGNAAQIVGVQHTQSFQMQMNAKMFSILTDKLYQNKEGAVIRELSANARDAHVAAGRGYVPFEITLPTWLSSEFKIRDFGTGIDPEEFYDVYTNLGHSTKDHEDTSIGAYGLGSKTPFAVTDSYTIRNFYDGTVYVYTAFKDTGMPTVSLIGSEPTDECNGLEISVDISSTGNVSAFQRQCKEQLAYFEVQPKIVNDPDFEWDEVPELSTGYNVKSGHYGSDVTVVMGGIPYTSSVRGLPDELQTALRRIELVLVAKLGEVDIPPSRESLEFTPKTIKFLQDKLTEIREDYVIDYSYQIENARNQVELHQVLISRVEEWISSKEFAITHFKFQGEEMLGRTLSDLTDQVLKDMTCKENNRHYKTLRARYSGTSVAIILRTLQGYRGQDTEGLVYLNDLSPRANKVILQNKRLLKEYSAVIFPSEQKSKLFAAAATLVELRLTSLGFKPVRLSTLMSMPVIVKGVKSKTYNRPDQIFRVDSSGHVNKTTLTELPTEGYYVPMSNWDTGTSESLLKFISNDLGKQVYALRSHAQGAVTKSDKWVNINTLNSVIVKVLTKRIKDFSDAEAKLKQVSLEVNESAFFDKSFEERSAGSDPKSKVMKLISGCREYQEAYDLTLLKDHHHNLKDLFNIPDHKSKAIAKVSLMKLATHAKDNYAQALSNVYHYNRWNSDNKGFQQTLNLIIGNFK